MAVIEAVLIFFGIWGIFTHITFDLDDGLFAMGDLAFSAGVVFINIKLLILELHNKTLVTFLGLLLSIGGWFLWNLILAGAYKHRIGPYTVHTAFTQNFGKTPLWWFTLIMVLIMVIVLELAVTAVRRIFWPQDQDLMQEVERRLGVAGLVGADDAEPGDTYIEEQEMNSSRRRGVTGAFGPWGWRRHSKKVSGDVYMAPPFATAPCGEQLAESTTGAGMRETKDGKKGTVTSVSEVKPEGIEAWAGDTVSDAGASGSALMHSPIKLQSPAGR